VVKLNLGLSVTGVVKISVDASCNCKALRRVCARIVGCIVIWRYTWYMCAMYCIIGFPMLDMVLELRLDLFGVLFDNLDNLGVAVVCVLVLMFLFPADNV
jgi:hypothetical protein